MQPLKKPIIILNFKTYAEGTGKNALKLARIVDKVSSQTGIYIAVAPQFTDIARIVKEANIPVFTQHIDPISYGSYTGHILPEAVKEIGAIGTLINHSERRMLLKDVEAAVKRAREVGLISIICADTPDATATVAKFQPNIVAVEPPELIGTGISVSKAKPEVVKNTIELVRKINLSIMILCGAGITKGEDATTALQLGTDGVLIASGIVKAKDQYTALLELVEAMTT